VLVSQPQIESPFTQIYAVTMVSASLLSLPPELICRIFQSADDFSVVAALAKTARNFYEIWRKHPTFICKAVVSNLADAEWLVDLEEEAKALRQDDCDDRAILRTKRLLFNARCASIAIGTFTRLHWGSAWWNADESVLWYVCGPRRVFTPSDLARFRHLFYCVWAVGIMARATHLQEQLPTFLDRYGPHKLRNLEIISSWVTHYYKYNYGCSDLDFSETWRAGCNLINKCSRADRIRCPIREDGDVTLLEMLEET
jgi:hypothetical protein